MLFEHYDEMNTMFWLFKLFEISTMFLWMTNNNSRGVAIWMQQYDDDDDEFAMKYSHV